jgi:hypothetical protein
MRVILMTLDDSTGEIKEFRMNAAAKIQLSGISCAIEREGEMGKVVLMYRNKILYPTKLLRE